jgi:hypothetical protein
MYFTSVKNILVQNFGAIARSRQVSLEEAANQAVLQLNDMSEQWFAGTARRLSTKIQFVDGHTRTLMYS